MKVLSLPYRGRHASTHAVPVTPHLKGPASALSQSVSLCHVEPCRGLQFMHYCLQSKDLQQEARCQQDWLANQRQQSQMASDLHPSRRERVHRAYQMARCHVLGAWCQCLTMKQKPHPYNTLLMLETSDTYVLKKKRRRRKSFTWDVGITVSGTKMPQAFTIDILKKLSI